MAQPRNISLSIENSTARRIDVSVSFNIEFRSVERNESFTETIELWGDDKMFNGKDHRLLTLNTETINANGMSTLTRSISRSVIRAMLNEDKNGKDEVYAKVIIEPMFSRVARASSVVRAKIKKKG